jgi:hypothetical protein
MRRRSVLLASVCAAAALLPSADVAAAGRRMLAPRGYLVVTFSGSGGGSYRFRDPAGAACRAAATSYAESDSYSWSYTFVLPPTGGRSGAPVTMSGTGLLSATEQTDRCDGAAVAPSGCTQSLRPPAPADAADLDYPGANVVESGRQITVGALGELVGAAAQPSCSGAANLLPNPVPGYAELQASVTFPRAQLSRAGVYRGTFTMAGAGLYAGVALSGSCNSTGCDTGNCSTAEASPPGPPATCSFGEGYSGSIVVRVARP